MGLASSLPHKSLGPRRISSHEAFPARLVCLAGFAIFATIGLHAAHIGRWAELAAAMSMAAALSILWCLHLQTSGLSPRWSGLLAACLLTVWTIEIAVISSGGWRTWWSALSCGVFVYAMLWVLDMHDGEQGLQRLATTALILALVVLARPPVILGCVLVSLIIFVGERGHDRGLLSSLLLLFTPFVLCLIFLGFMNHFLPGEFLTIEWNLNAPGVRTCATSDTHSPQVLHLGVGSFVFLLAVLAVRLFEQKSGKSDLALMFLVLFLATVGTMRGMPGHLSVDDLWFVITCGSCALLSLAPPSRLPARIAVCIAAIAPFAINAWH